jgi:hypothetical protein
LSIWICTAMNNVAKSDTELGRVVWAFQGRWAQFLGKRRRVCRCKIFAQQPAAGCWNRNRFDGAAELIHNQTSAKPIAGPNYYGARSKRAYQVLYGAKPRLLRTWRQCYRSCAFWCNKPPSLQLNRAHTLALWEVDDIPPYLVRRTCLPHILYQDTT